MSGSSWRAARSSSLRRAHGGAALGLAAQCGPAAEVRGPLGGCALARSRLSKSERGWPPAGRAQGARLPSGSASARRAAEGYEVCADEPGCSSGRGWRRGGEVSGRAVTAGEERRHSRGRRAAPRLRRAPSGGASAARGGGETSSMWTPCKWSVNRRARRGGRWLGEATVSTGNRSTARGLDDAADPVNGGRMDGDWQAFRRHPPRKSIADGRLTG